MAHQIYNQNDQPKHLKDSSVAAVMVPFPMQGHLNETLHLSNLIASYGIPVHFVGSTTHNHQAKLRLHGWDPENTSKIQFHDLQLPPLTSVTPKFDPHTTFPGHLQPLFDASFHLRQPVFQLLQELSTKFRRIIIIHDTLIATVVQDVKLIPNAESYALHSVSAFAIFFYIWESITNKPFQLDSDIPNNIPSSEGCFTPEFADYAAKQYKVLNFESGRIYNTCRPIEGRYMDLLEKLPTNANKKLFAIGPLNPVEVKGRYTYNRHQCLEWLDKQEKDSVIYISFGTSTSMTKEQIIELAVGLERSRQKFLWVVRSADEVELSAEGDVKRPQLPEGYESRIQDRGMVVRDWAPQLEVLAHPSTGGFMSHCGWNSCMESISMGVPIAAWPMHSDQPRNTILVTQVQKFGIEVRDWAQRNELVTSTTIENAVRKLMISKEGEEMRKQAAELGGIVRGSNATGGSSRLEMDSFIAHITR
ncbi:zeatin O-glucosyltransferase-like [Chenopodium quinoa]|uniref:zeatin O-glucosyltransferase-like n=1 Tax=Chenopodium quinoa TaxID=63459 RepID=UPI000B791FB6|nr:zeatin O-glucosyltransferase-like [Chenopodium quinoa]